MTIKRKEEPEEGSSYSWMDTYGDMVTLLLCFFVLLYSFSSVDAEKWNELVGAFSGSYSAGAVSTFDESTVREEPINKIDSMINYNNRDEQNVTAANVQQQQLINDTFDELYEKIKSYIETNGMESQLSVSRTDAVIALRFNEMALFNSAQATILPGSKETLRHIIEIINENISSIKMVKIEGHTDNVPIHTMEFADNWDLAAKRATNTLRLVLASGLIDENKLSAIGYGEYQPISTNDTAEGRSQNRRVDFVLEKIELI